MWKIVSAITSASSEITSRHKIDGTRCYATHLHKRHEDDRDHNHQIDQTLWH
jgi:hypothetical protein